MLGGVVGGVHVPPVHVAWLWLVLSDAQRTYSVVTDAGVESEFAPACIVTVVAPEKPELPAHWML